MSATGDSGDISTPNSIITDPDSDYGKKIRIFTQLTESEGNQFISTKFQNVSEGPISFFILRYASRSDQVTAYSGTLSEAESYTLGLVSPEEPKESDRIILRPGDVHENIMIYSKMSGSIINYDGIAKRQNVDFIKIGNAAFYHPEGIKFLRIKYRLKSSLDAKGLIYCESSLTL